MQVTTKLSLLASSALLLALGASCTQPRMNCTTAHVTYAAQYTLKSGDPTSPCGSIPGEYLEMQTYFATGGLNGTPKFSEPSLAIRADLSVTYNETPGEYPVEVPGFTYDYYAPNALGKFISGLPDDSDFCTATDMKPSVVSLPELPEYMVEDDPETPEDETATVPASPPTTLRYEWSKARWVVTPDAQGTQFDGTVKISIDGCTAEYDVLAVSPAVGCETDDDCADPAAGINPDFAVTCNVDLGLCVPSKKLPAYK